MGAAAWSAIGRVRWRLAGLAMVLNLVATALAMDRAPQPGSLTIRTASAQDMIERPVDGASATLPLHVLAHLGRPGGRVHAAVRWQRGAELHRSVPVLADKDGRGLVAANLDWDAGSRPVLPSSQPAILELTDEAGGLLGRRQITVLGPTNPALRAVALYFVGHGDSLVPVQRRVPPTPRIATATLEELLWGPAPGDPSQLTTAIPTPEDVLTYPGRGPDWGAQVRLRQARIVDGVATADFSKELRAYGGGSLRVGLIHRQISLTLGQFPDVQRVAITIEGEPGGVLEP
jgi:Sporulation and spore germination